MDLKIDGYDVAGSFTLVLEMLVLFGTLMEGHNNQKTIDFFRPGMFNFQLAFSFKSVHLKMNGRIQSIKVLAHSVYFTVRFQERHTDAI